MTNIFQNRKVLSRILLPFLTIWLCCFSTKSNAVESITIAIGASIVLHAVVAAIVFDTSSAVTPPVGGTAGGGGVGGGLQVQINPNNPVPTPAGWTENGDNPIPPQNSNSVTKSGYRSFGYVADPVLHSSILEACTVQINFQHPGQPVCNIGNNCGRFTSGYCDTGIAYAQLNTVVDCNAGYNLNGTNCILSNAAMVTKPADGKCQMLRDTTLNTFKVDANDPDCKTVIQLDANGQRINIDAADVQATDKSITVTRDDGTKTTYKLLNNGGGQIQTVSYDAASNTTRYSTTQLSPPAPDGAVTVDGLSSSRVPGGGTLAGSSPAGSAGGGNGGLTTGGANGSGTGAGATDGTGTGWPDDYARSGESGDAAGKVVDKLDGIAGLLTAPVTSTSDPVNSEEMPFFGTTFSGLTSWQLPAHASQCPTPSMDLGTKFGGVYVMNSHCALMADHGAKLRLAMIAAWSILSLFVVLRA